MSRKLRAMREARERKRLEGVEPSYPRELPALRRTLIIIDYDFRQGRASCRSLSYAADRLLPGGRQWCGVEAPRRVVEGARRSSRQVSPRARSLIFDVGLSWPPRPVANSKRSNLAASKVP